jgi:RimJ/RimL family protein N-acetyltransferase
MKPPEFKTQRFNIKPYHPTYKQRFIEMGLDPFSVRFMGGSNGDEREEKELFKSIFQLYKNTDSNRWFWIWGVYEKEKLVAHFELKETENTAQDELEIVYMVHPEERKRGVMSEVLDFFKENQNQWKRKIIATLSPENQASKSLLERWGIEKKIVLKDKETTKEYLKVWLK